MPLSPDDPTAAEQIRQRYLGVDASNVADVLDTLGLPDQGLAPAFAPYPADAAKLAGGALGPVGGFATWAIDATAAGIFGLVIGWVVAVAMRLVPGTAH